MRLLLSLIAVLLMSGCRGTTQLPIDSKIGYDPRTGLINLSLPKNSSGKELRFKQTIGTNTMSLLLRDFSFTNSPAVLDAAGAANVAAINALGAALNSALAAALAGAGRVPMAVQPTLQYQVVPPATLLFTNSPSQ